MTIASVRRSRDDRVLAGVCAGIAETIGVDPTLIRLVFTLLVFAGGAGVVLYVAIWLYLTGKGWLAVAALLGAAGLALRALGLSAQTAAALVLISCGLALIWRRGRSLRPGAPLSVAGLALAAGGVALLFLRGSSSISFLAPGAFVGAFLFVIGPWLWQLALERDAERTARIRNEERADVTARVHDSVLQTLALIQKHAGEQTRVASLARRQERELRSWLYDSPSSDETLVGALTAAAADVEELHGVRVEVASGGDCAVDGDVAAVVLAAREAMQNAAKFSGSDEISVYAEANGAHVSVFVRDRGKGFDRSAVPADRRGLADSIEARMTRAGGTARIVAALGAGTEIELLLPRKLP
ncbi:MAG TPA: PspC domain-containing protein [Gaiellaceae bacterium]|jgi:signal transduction histidine kinase